MANYSSDEVEAVITRLVRSSIRRGHDPLGSRRTDVTFSDIQEAAAGVFLLYQRTPFYFAFLSSSRLLEQVQNAEEQILELLSALAVLRRRVLPVKDVSSLANARAALLELESAVSRVGPPKDLSKVPAYARFNANVDRFLGAVGQNIKSNGTIVPTPEEARAKLPGMVAGLKASLESIVSQVALIQDALSNYAKVNLPQLVSQGVIQRARQVLSDRVDQLESMSEQERLTVLRDTVLEVLGTRAIVRRFGSFTPPASLANLTGTGTPFSDSDRPANAAYLDCDKYGPYVLVPGTTEATSTNVLSLYVDGAPSYPSAPTTKFFLPPSMVAKIEGVQAGTFHIQTGVNDTLSVQVGVTTYPVTLTAGTAQTPAQVASDITTALTGSNFQGEAYFFPLMFEGEVVTSGNTIALAYGSFPANSINVGDEVDFYYGPNATTTRTVTAVSPSVANPASITVNGAVLTSGTDRVRYGSSSRRVRIVPVNRTLAVQNKQTVQLLVTSDLTRNTGIALGMYGSLLGKSSPTDAETVAAFISANSTKFEGQALFTPTFTAASFRSEPSDAFTLVAYNHRGNASWGTGTIGVTVTLVDLPAASLVGQTLCLREGNNPGVVGSITAQTGAVLTVTFGSAVTASSGLVEVGTSSGLASDMVIWVDSGPNQGKYFVDTVDATIPFQCKLRTILPVYRDGFNTATLMVGRVGKESVRFLSRTTNLTSKVEIYDPLTVFMNTAGPHAANGTTNYFKLPRLPTDLEAGDFLEFFTTNADHAAYERVLTRVDADAVVQLDTAIDSTVSWPFGGPSLPFVLLRTDKVVNFDDFSKTLGVWLERSDANPHNYFIDLNRFIQPLLANMNPTDSDVGSSESRIKDLRAILTMAGASSMNQDPTLSLEALLNGYSVPFVPEADALIRAFKEKGADRAVDILLSCQFTTFFGLDQDELSYAGNLQKAAREVARSDLPVRRVNRDAQFRSPLVGSTSSPDYEYETPDLDTSPNIDPPVDVG